MHVHVCLVSARAATCLLPVLDPLPRPARVVLVSGEGMQQRAGNLRAVLQAQGIAVEQLQLQDARDVQRIRVQMSDAQLDSRSLGLLLDHFWRAGALDVLGDEIRWVSEAALDFMAGGWLQCHAMGAVNRLTGPLGIHDRALALQYADAEQGSGGTVDLAFVARNRLFILALDTARSGRAGMLDALLGLAAQCQRLDAAAARGMLLSHRRPGRQQRQLASLLGLELVAGTSLMDLDRKISHWVRAAT